MALTKRNYVSGETVITAKNLNEIQDAIIALESAGDDGTHPVYYIDLAGSYPNYTCPVAMADIKAAYEAGKGLVSGGFFSLVVHCLCLSRILHCLRWQLPPEMGFSLKKQNW